MEFTTPEAQRRFVSAALWPVASRRELRIGRVKCKVVEAAYLKQHHHEAVTSYVVIHLEEQVWKSRTVWRQAAPAWRQECEFGVCRHDATLLVQVFAEGESHDDLVGGVEIALADLAGLNGTVRRWYKMAPYDGWISLHIAYEVSAVGEAMSRVWADPLPERPPYPPFDINALYNTFMTFSKETKPYMDAATEFELLLKWTDVSRSRAALVAALALSIKVSYFLTVAHLAIAAWLVFQYNEAQRLEHLRSEAAEIFSSFDDDRTGYIDNDEFKRAINGLIDKAQPAGPRPTDDDIDQAFRRFANKDGYLGQAEFLRLLEAIPKIVWGYDKVAREEQEKLEQEEELLEEDLDEEIQEITRERWTFFKKKKDKGAGDDGPIKGVARTVVNLAGRKFTGRSVAWAKGEADVYSKQLAFARCIVEWRQPALSAAAVAANVVLAAWHCVMPFWLSCAIFWCCAFFYYSEKRRFLEKLVKEGPGAWRRYKDLIGGNVKSYLLEPDTSNMPVAPKARVCTDDARDVGLRVVIRSIFSRLDADGNGRIDAGELLDFVAAAIPRATPTLRAACLEPGTLETQVDKIISDFQRRHANSVGAIDSKAIQGFQPNETLDISECTTFFTSTTVARILVQDEVRRQLEGTGLACLKLPSKHDGSTSHLPHLLGAHDTALTLRGTKLHGKKFQYTTRRGAVVSVAAASVLAVAPSATNVIFVKYKHGLRRDTTTLFFSLSSALRDNLLDLLVDALRPTEK